MTDKTNDYFGTYADSINSLINSIDARWYTKNDYGAYRDYTGIKYGLMRGISLTNTTFTINNEKDFAYMFELFNADDKFASNELTYTITANLNLDKLPISSYTYKKGIGATIVGATVSGTPIMANGDVSSYPTIYNADVMSSSRIVKSTGVDCYGLFNYLTGTVENINVVPKAMDFGSIESSTNAKGIGVLSGYIEGGHVKNVNVYANITNTSSKNIGEYYVGGISGILGGNGKINGATSAGSINLNSASTTLQSNSSYMGGVAIGGIVGYIESSNGALYTCLNAMDITSKLGASITYAIGGVVGAGYTMNYDKTVVNGVTTELLQTGQLENVGSISVGDSTYHTYSDLYVAGIMGRHLGELDEVSKLTNNGSVSVYSNGTGNTYVCGVENVDIMSSAINNTKVEASQFKDGAGNTLFYGSSFANGGNVVVSGSATNLHYTNVLNLKASNNVKSKLSDLYNLAYGYKYTGNVQKTLTKLSAQTISMNTHTVFAPVLNVIGGTSQYTTEAVTLYNLRPINYTMSSTIDSAMSLKYAGVALGTNISYYDIRNEGNLTFSIDKAVTVESTLKVSGVLEEISEGSYARLVFNGGDITFNDANNVTKMLNIYASGICHSSNGVITATNQNPLNADYDSSLKGSLDSAINNGKISFESAYINKTRTFDSIQSSNYQGKLYFSGIAYENSGIISNTFNLGNILIGIIGYSGKEYFAAGISNVNNGQYAQIRDSANNGEIRNIVITNLTPNVRSSGISITNNSEKQVMAFVINYGTIYAFLNQKEDDRASGGDTAKYSQASGILTLGLCNIVNVVNYGNIYANANAGGMIAKLDLSLYGSNPSEIKIANALNYGNVMSIKNHYSRASVAYYADYNSIKELQEVSLSEVQANDYYGYIDRGVLANNQFNGALIGVANYNNKNKIVIRYLMNFALGGISIVSSEYNNTSVSTDVATLYNVESDVTMNQILNGQATYAPLSTDVVGGNIGVFNKKFPFRRAIEGDSTIIDSNQITDKYLSNFLQFIPFEKVSDSIINKIGWKSLAYQAAAEDFMKDLDKVVVLLNKTSSSTSNYSTLVADATTTDAWLNNCNTDILRSLFDEVIETGELTPVKEVINYVLFTADSRTGISLEFRNSLIQEILGYLEADAGDNGINYYELLNALLYDELLANIISGANTNYAELKSQIQTIINGKDKTELEPIVERYLAVLNDTPEVLDPLFLTYQTKYLATKIDVLETLLEGFSNDEIEKLYNLIVDSGVDASSVKYYSYLLSHTATAKSIFSNIIAISANESNQTFIEAMNRALKQYGLSEMLKEVSIDSSSANYDSSLATNFNNNLNSYISNASYAQDATTADYTTGNRNVTSLNVTPDKDYVTLWNTIKNNPRVKEYLESVLSEVYSVDSAHEKGIYAPATEYNNTYQSLDGPSNSTDGLTMKNPGIVRYADGTDLQTNIGNRFIYTPDEVVSYGTHFYGPFKSKTNETYATGAGRRYLDLEDTGTTNSTKKKYVPIFISSDYETIYNKISNTANPKVYEMVWNNYNKTSSKYQWVSKVILDRNAGDSTSILYNNLATGSTYTYGGYQVTTEYIVNGYDFNPDLIRTAYDDRRVVQTLPTGTYYYKNLKTGSTLSTTVLANTNVNLVTNGANYSTFTDPDHKYRNFYFTGYVSASLITGVYYHHSIWVASGVTQGVYLTAKDDEKDPVDNWRGVQTTGYINYFIDDLINLDGVRTKGKSDGRVSWDECNIINSVVKYILSTQAGKDVVLHALADVSINGISDNNMLMMLLKTIDVNNANITFKENSILSMVLSSDTSVIRTTLNGKYYLNEYLQDLISGEVYNHKDIVIQTGAVDRDSFITIFKEAYSYSKYSELYKDYSGVVKSTINDYIYEYINDVLYSETDENISDSLSMISDTDLTNITELFTSSSSDRMHIDDSTYSGFEVINTELYGVGTPNYPTADTYDNITYDKVLVGNEVVDGQYTSGLVFTTGTYSYGYTLEVIYKGNGIALLSEDTDYFTSSSVITKYENINLAPNTEYWILYTNESSIYSIKLLESEYTGYSSEKVYYDDAVSPFAVALTNPTTATSDVIVSNDKITIVSNGNNYYYYTVSGGKSGSNTYSFRIDKPTNVNLISATIAFKIGIDIPTYFPTTINTTGLTTEISTTLNDTNITTVSPKSFDVTTLANSNKTISISLSSNNTSSGVGAKSKTVYLYDVIITYNYTLANGTNVVFTQNVLNPGYSEMTFTNSNSNKGVYIDSAHNYVFPTHNGSTYSGIVSPVTYKSWYNEAITTPSNLVNTLNTNDMSMVSLSGISSSFIDNYVALSNYAKYLLRNVVYSYDVNSDSIDLDEDSFVFVKVRGDSGSTFDLDTGTPVNLSTEYDYYAFELSMGSHSVVTTGSNVEIAEIYVINKDSIVSITSNGSNNTITFFDGNSSVELFNADYSDMATLANNINTIIPTALEDMTKYQTFIEVYPYSYCNRTSPTINRLADLKAIVSNLFPSITDDSGRFVFDYDNYSVFTVLQVKELINSIAAVDYDEEGSSLDKLIIIANTHYDEILKYIVGSEEVSITTSQQASLVDALKKIRALSIQNNYNEIKKYFNAAYVGDNFINKSDLSQMTTSIVYTLLDNYSNGRYNFITSNSTVSGEIFKDLLVHLEFSTANDNTYGIYALSSSQGIGNGIFIPDNLTLSTMDSEYYYNSSESILKLGDDDVSYWRGGESLDSGDEGTVDYAFYHDMKQLIKSISTDVFELNVTANSVVLNSVDDQIDNVNKVITYYLTSGLGSIYNASSITINDGYRLANGATISSLTIPMTGTNVVKTQGVSVIINDAIKVDAEDTGVSSRYTLRFIAIDPSGLTLSSDVSSIGYNGGTVTLSVTGHDLPDGLDLEPYINLSVNGVLYNSADGYWKLDPGFDKNAVVKNEAATIKIIIDKSLPGGVDAVEIKINLANNPYVELTKVQNTSNLITSFGFVPFGAANQEWNSSVPTSITSTIPYGRAYNYSDLTDYNSSNFYLYTFDVSDNATVEITATKEVLTSGLMKYVVTYRVTAEAGGNAKVYKHTLTEAQHFAEGSQYASIYADGDEVTISSSYNTLPANEKPKYLYEGTLNYSLSADECDIQKFDSRATYYRINYSVASVDENTFTTNGSLYTLSNGIYNKVTSGSYNSQTTYYKRNYIQKAVTAATYKTDGSLYRLIDGEYVQVLNGAFNSGTTYYSIQYVEATPTITSQTFTTNGSLYKLVDGVYTQVIDRSSIYDDMFASVAFNRTDAYGNSIEPQYRIKYSLSNFYTIGNNVEFGTTDSTLGNLATTNITYAGLTVTVSENNDTGTYRFIYTYKNTGIWENGEAYIRYYEFPEFIVEKQASTDALLHKLTFLEESIVLGNTATVILPTVPLVPDKTGQYYDNTEAIYKDQFESTTRQIVVSATGIKYNNADATSITDYYAVGTVSDADLSYYCPGFEINEYAQVYQYTTYKKLTEYGLGKQEDSDKNILSVHDNMYLYVPYILNGDTVILLVELDENGYWTNVYTTDFAGQRYIKVTSGSYVDGMTYYVRSGNEYVSTTVTQQTFTTNGSLYIDSLLHTYEANYVNARNAYTYGEFGGYKVSEVSGSPDKNSSLYMDYAGTPLDGHFWYVSYVVFSEDALCGGNSNGNVRYYHISIVDATNNVQFDVTIYADTSFNLGDIYFTISETTYKKVNEVKTETGKRQISAYADDSNLTYTGNRYDISGFKIYELKYKLQTLPSGYFYFYVDLPDGYIAEARTNKTNNISTSDANKYPGAFDPQTSIITVKIELEIVIKKGTNEDSNVWAFNTTDIYTREAEYKGTIVG